MDKLKTNLYYNFNDHKFPDISLERCSYSEYQPSQTDNVCARSDTTVIVVTDGKGVVTDTEKRYTITKGSGVLLTGSINAKFKSDSIEPLSCVSISISGESAKDLVSMIEKRESGTHLDFGSNAKITDSARDLITECSRTYTSDYGIMLSFYDFVNSLFEHYMEKKLPTKNIYMTRAVEYIKQNYNKSLSVEGISNMLGIERSYLSRLFKTYKNKSTQNYIIDYRMRQAKRMFEEEDMNVSQVCTAVGYTNIYCFSRIFKSRIGMPPKEYMERCRNHEE